MMKQYEVLQKYLDGAMPLKTKSSATPKHSALALDQKSLTTHVEQPVGQPMADNQTSEKNSHSNPF